MKTNKIYAAAIIASMIISTTGCSTPADTTNAVPSNAMPATSEDTSAAQVHEDTSTAQNNDTTEAASQDNSNSGTADYVSSDSRITPVNINDYWISDSRFDFINYCRDQGATVKYLIEKDGGGYTFCLPEDLAGTGKTPLAIGASFYFGGGSSEYVHVDCPFGELSDTYWVTGANVSFHPCIGTSRSGGTDVRITIDDIGNTLSLSTINHLPVIFEYIMTLPYDATQQDVVNTFKAHYHDNE